MKTYTDSLAPEFRRRLAERELLLRAALTDNAGQSTATEAAMRGEVLDFKDLASEQSVSEVEDIRVDHAAHELEQVLAAQRKMTDHRFGDCEACGKAIDLRRLEAMPAAPLCALCQAKREELQQRR